MASIPKLVTGLVKTLKNRAKRTHLPSQKETSSSTQATTHLAANATLPSATPITDELLKGKPFQTNVYVDKSSNTVLRIKIPEAHYEKICAQLLQQGDLVHAIKNIFLFHNLEKPVRRQYDAQNNTVWDILIHTQDKDKQSAILAMLANKKDLFKLNTPSLDQISSAPKLYSEKQTQTVAKAVVSPQKYPPTQAAKATQAAKTAKPQVTPPSKKSAPAKPTTPAKPTATPPPQKTVAPAPSAPSPEPVPKPEKPVATPPAPAPEPEKPVATPPAPTPEPEKPVETPPAPTPEPEKPVATPPAPTPETGNRTEHTVNHRAAKTISDTD